MLARSVCKLALAAIALAGLLLVPPPRTAQAAILPCTVTWGTYVTNVPVSMTNVTNLDNELNRHSQIVHMYTQWGASWGTFSFNQPLFNSIHNYSSVGSTGAIPLLTWEAWGPNFTITPAEIPLTSIANGQYDAYINSWANGLKSLGYPVYLDFGHEMNGNWYPWGYGVNGNTPAQYLAAFRHVHDRFVAANATNVLWVWNPDHWSPSGISQQAFYPGDSYVDWLAIDVYNWNTSWNTPYNNLAPSYATVVALNATKPLMLAEFGSENAPTGANPPSKAAWITLFAQTLPVSFPRVKAVVWFNEINTALTVDSPAAVLTASQAAFGSCGAPAPTPTPTPQPTPTPTPRPTPTATPQPTPTATPQATPTPQGRTPSPTPTAPIVPPKAGASTPATHPSSAPSGGLPPATPAASPESQSIGGVSVPSGVMGWLMVLGWGAGIYIGLRVVSRLLLGR